MLSLNKIIDRFTKRKPRIRGHGLNKPAVNTPESEPLIIPRSEHTISRKHISPAALKVLYGLKEAGYDAYLVGGCVRDLLLGHKPKDFDVTTNATPEQVHKVFHRSQLIGRRFKLVHVRFGREVIEVATFRAPPEADQHDDGRIMRDNVYGTMEQDAWRRDFTINALYYTINDFSVIDYTGGLADLKAGNIKMIGDVETRYREDPVRILRALRFVGKLGLKLDEQTKTLIPKYAELLADIPAARLFDEVLKLYLSGNAITTHGLLCQYQVFEHLFPQTHTIEQKQDDKAQLLLIKALENTDKRIAEDQPVTPAFLFAAILWEPARLRWQHHISRNIPPIPALQRAATDVIVEQVQRVAVPKRFTMTTRDIWMLQPRLEMRTGKRAFRLLTHPKFRAGYDFLLLRSVSGDELIELADWWTQFQFATEAEQLDLVKNLAPTPAGKKRKPRRKRAKKPVVKSD